ncbi:ATP-binding cassette domain-containing protein [Tessaracoccus flavus]|uniref:ATP-binding cassette domain-containing protein n=1 Tax=Tessaracoccus flavus TaxID=1610493 RepID=UPI001D04C905|nr:ATP-binding cassette domain-containing protein [Tessaracoccus flavus]
MTSATAWSPATAAGRSWLPSIASPSTCPLAPTKSGVWCGTRTTLPSGSRVANQWESVTVTTAWARSPRQRLPQPTSNRLSSALGRRGDRYASVTTPLKEIDLLRFEDVTYSYARRRAPVLRNFTYEFPSGRSVLLGPNGAGKSTLMSLAVGWRTPQAGTVSLGPDVGPKRSASRRAHALAPGTVGFMPQDIRHLPGLTVIEQVRYAGWLKGMRQRDTEAKSRELLCRLGLEDKMADSAKNLSGGQLRRMGLAMAMVHEPKVLILDEPTAGLDPAQRSNFRELIAQVSDSEMIISTHQVDDIQAIYSNVAVLLSGQVVWEGTPREFVSLAPEGPHQAELAFKVVMKQEGLSE